MRLALIGVTDGREGPNDFLLRRLSASVGKDEVNISSLGPATVDVTLDVEGAHLVGGREALNLTASRSQHLDS